MEVVKSKIVHINSKLYKDEVPQKQPKVLFPSQEFSAKDENEFHRLTLLSFAAKRTWNCVNPTNSTFYDISGGVTQNTFTIPNGDYTATQLATAIQTQLDAIYGGSTCTYDDITDKFTVTMGGTFPPTSSFYSYARRGTGNNSLFFSYLLLGGNGSVEGQPVKELWDRDASNPRIFTSKRPIRLDTMTELFLRTTLENNNFTTSDKYGAPNDGKMAHTDLFARIPVFDSNSQELKDVKNLSFTDFNDNWQIYSSASTWGSATFDLVDENGRFINEFFTAGEANNDNNLEYSMILRWDLMKKIDRTETLLGCLNDNRTAQLLDPRQDLRYR